MRWNLYCAAALALASVPARAGEAGSAPALAARPFALGQVHLLESPFLRAMGRNAEYLLVLEPDRLLHNARLYAGLQPKGECYGGWEAAGIAGHTLGHYLTALSQQYAATGDPRFRERIDYIVRELDECQRAYGDGYVGALPPKELATLRGLRAGTVEPEGPHTFKGGSWVPWYTEHKVLCGLKDAWVLGGNDEARAVALRLADWVGDVTRGLSQDQLQAMLSVEHGGMMDVLAELYALTGDHRYLETSRRFYHRAVLDPLLAGRDQLPGLHANTQIPKVIGEARTYEVTGDRDARAIAETFWGLVVHHHSYVIGGNSENEHFFQEEATGKHLGSDTAETCNTYNMLKLTEHLMAWNPSCEYADYYERALYNDILASQEPRLGMFTYFMSLKPGLFRSYSTPFNSFWCCVGTGMENHTKYGAAIYSRGRDELFVNLFIPSVLQWADKGLALSQTTDYPASSRVLLAFDTEPSGPLTLRIRCPGWARAPVRFTLNGRVLDTAGKPGTYAALREAWRKGDRLEVTLPMSVRREALAGDPRRVAFLYGPVVLAGDLGPAPQGGSVPYEANQGDNLDAATVPVPVLSPGSAPLEACILRDSAGPLSFHTSGVGRPADFTLKPFAELSYERYSVYWEVVPRDPQATREPGTPINF